MVLVPPVVTVADIGTPGLLGIVLLSYPAGLPVSAVGILPPLSVLAPALLTFVAADPAPSLVCPSIPVPPPPRDPLNPAAPPPLAPPVPAVAASQG